VHKSSSASVLNCVKVIAKLMFKDEYRVVDIVELITGSSNLHEGSMWDPHIYIREDF
jgi:hypothetical protein